MVIKDKNKPEGKDRHYGYKQEATINPDADVTDKQEYHKKGLPRTQKYSVDKVGQTHH